ncbi:ribosomal protein L7/L12 [Bacillus sp. 1P06AnD]|uniref:ribosomal protein L7/L12 n=1 Tax=Bacillus sp. 1P06AnD TaxID=3132208 RepID=UPI0039A3E3F5
MVLKMTAIVVITGLAMLIWTLIRKLKIYQKRRHSYSFKQNQDAINSKVRKMLQNGYTKPAIIKVVRQRTGLGLFEAKQYVERMTRME